MCTAMTAQTPKGNFYFGRTMDFSYPLDPELYVIPKGYKWSNRLKTRLIQNRYSIMGIGQDISPVTLADGVNETGFAAAVLYFPGYAKYDPAETQRSSKISIAALELVNFLLGQCASVKEAVSTLSMLRIVGITDPVTDSVAPLHWIITDRSGQCRVIEKMADGLHIMENPIGVLSNSPDFQWHVTNLRNYMNVTSSQLQENSWNTVTLSPFGQGTGTFGLPGDYTPPARFVRTAYLKTHTPLPEAQDQAVSACFHILEGVSIPKGSVMTNRETADYTQYTTFIDLSSSTYFFRTYDNCRITSARFPDMKKQGADIFSCGKLNRPASFEQWN